MKELFVPRIMVPRKTGMPGEAALLLGERAPVNSLDTVNWPSFPFRPDVEFRIGHCDDLILLKFSVSGDNARARVSRVNGPVHTDSCVEFFFSPLSDQRYFNFEFNCVGVPHVAFGKGRSDRVPLDPAEVCSIMRLASLGDGPVDEDSGPCSWDLMLCIPVGIFRDCGIRQFGGLCAQGNFYKCGDETISPHYLSWAPVGTVKPDFHQYDFFGSLVFE